MRNTGPGLREKWVWLDRLLDGGTFSEVEVTDSAGRGQPSRGGRPRSEHSRLPWFTACFLLIGAGNTSERLVHSGEKEPWDPHRACRPSWPCRSDRPLSLRDFMAAPPSSSPWRSCISSIHQQLAIRRALPLAVLVLWGMPVRAGSVHSSLHPSQPWLSQFHAVLYGTRYGNRLLPVLDRRPCPEAA